MPPDLTCRAVGLQTDDRYVFNLVALPELAHNPDGDAVECDILAGAANAVLRGLRSWNSTDADPSSSSRSKWPSPASLPRWSSTSSGRSPTRPSGRRSKHAFAPRAHLWAEFLRVDTPGACCAGCEASQWLAASYAAEFAVEVGAGVVEAGDLNGLAQGAAQATGLAGNTSLTTGDAERLPYPDGTFDALVCECAL